MFNITGFVASPVSASHSRAKSAFGPVRWDGKRSGFEGFRLRIREFKALRGLWGCRVRNSEPVEIVLEKHPAYGFVLFTSDLGIINTAIG